MVFTVPAGPEKKGEKKGEKKSERNGEKNPPLDEMSSMMIRILNLCPPFGAEACDR
jgi:hypothetical protein